MTAVFLQGNALSVLEGVPSDFFHCAVTSPPYYGLRAYNGGKELWSDGWRGQLGAEPTPDLYISHLVQICREVKRVLRPDGVFWLNIGDSWAGGKGRSGGPSPADQAERNRDGSSINRACDNFGTGHGVTRSLDNRSMLHAQGIKPLDMVLIPSLLALALRADGWYVRSMVVWSKDNPMPESVNGWRWERHKVKVGNRGREQSRMTGHYQNHSGNTIISDAVWQDCPGCPACSPNGGYVLRKGSWRPTDSYEFILMLTKTGSYFCDKEAVSEPIAESTVGRGKVDFGGAKGRGYNPNESDPNFRNGSEQWGRTYDYTQSNGSGGRNLRSVWSFPTKPFPGAHFATYPPRLPETCIKSSTSEYGCCPQCGAPYARVIDRGAPLEDWKRSCGADSTGDYHGVAQKDYGSIHAQDASATKARILAGMVAKSTVGWRPTCSCPPSDPVPCRVLDWFSGAGTTALACERLGLDSVSIDTSAEYIAMSRARLAEDEQKRIDEFIRQAKREARAGGNGHRSASKLSATVVTKVK